MSITKIQLWAKLGSNAWPNEFHPLICHLIDVACIAEQLWENVLRPRLRNWICERLGLDAYAAKAWLSFWVGAHDIGKACPGFQVRGDDVRMTDLHRVLNAGGFNFPPGETPTHGHTGTVILHEELKRDSNQLCHLVAVAVGGHHGLFFGTDELGDCLGNDRWTETRKLILGDLAAGLGIKAELRRPNLPTDDDQSVWMFLAGLTSVADWVGSNASYFPPIGCPKLLNDGLDLDWYWARSRQQAKCALNELGWLQRAEPSGSASVVRGSYRHQRRIAAVAGANR